MKFIQWIFVLLAVTISLICGVSFAELSSTEREQRIREQREREVEEAIEHVKKVYHIRFAIETLQPFYQSESPNRAKIKKNLAYAIYKAATDHEIDYRYAVALAARESSFLPKIGTGKIDGSRGERGYFQIFPIGKAEITCSRGCNQYDIQCNAQTAMCWLDRCRDLCGDDPWMYLGGYGRSSCPKNVSIAKTWTELRVLRGKLCNGFGEDVCNELLPL